MQKNLFIGTPVYQGALDPLYVLSLIRSLSKVQAYLKFLPGDSLVSRARNNIAAEFLKSDKTHLLFIDSDIIFTEQDVETLLENDVPLVGGIYPKKTKELKWVVNSLEGKTEPDEKGLLEVRYIGTGFMLIAREVFETIQKAFPEIEYDDDTTKETKWDFFKVGVHERRHLSEDWFFCEMWRQCGGQVFADTRVRMRHSGNAIYPLEIMQ